MKIQILSQSFYPDHSGISLYSSDFAFYVSQKGHDVEVITGYPFYPQWKKRKEDRRKLFSTEYIDKVKILRGYIYVPQKPTTFKRVIHEITLITSACFNFFRATKPDVIVVFTTPILLGFITVIFKKLYRCKLVINVQDFQLEAASSLQMSKQKFLFKILSWLEAFSYKNANLVTSISLSMYNILFNDKKLNKNKIDLWPNWIKKNEYILNGNEKGIFKEMHGISVDDKIIAYAGNVGLKQGLELLIDVANEFSKNKNYKFFIIGQGAALNNLIVYASEKNIHNIYFLPLLNSNEYLNFLNDIDIFFLPQKKTDFDVYFPSKLLGLMAAKKTILLSADKNSELYKTIKTYNAGIVTEFGDVNAIKNCINEILNDSDKALQINKNADQYVSQFERDIVLKKIFDKIITL